MRGLRNGLVTAFLLGGTFPLGLIVRRRYGRAAARRFAAGTTAALLGQQVLVTLALKRRTERDGSWHRLTVVDGITLRRGATGALMVGLIASGVRHRRGFGGGVGWLGVRLG